MAALYTDNIQKLARYPDYLIGEVTQPSESRLNETRRVANIGRASLARENEAGGSWGQEVHILHVNI